MTRKQNSKPATLAQIKTLQEKGLEKVPGFYDSMADNPTMDRMHRTTVRDNLPMIVEYLEGAITLDSQGKSAIIIPFKKQIFSKPPLVVGFGQHPDGRVLKFPAEDSFEVWDFYAGFVGTFYTYLGIGKITTNNVQILLDTKYRVDFDDLGNESFTYYYPGKVFRYKLRVYDVK